MSHEITGTIKKVFDTEKITNKFSKREFVIETTKEVGDKTYTETIKFQLINDQCTLIDGYTDGETLTVNFNIKGNEWEKDGKIIYFLNLEAWKIEGGEKKVDNSSQHPDEDIPPEDDTDEFPF